MHPRLVELFDYLDTQHETLRAAVDSVPHDRRAIRPDGEWSAEDVVTHLVLVERRLTNVIEQAIAQARQNGVEQEMETTAVLPALNLSTMLDRTRRIVASEAVDPRVNGERLAQASYDAAREHLKTVLRGGDGLAFGRIMHQHPRLGLINLYEWMAFVGAHEARHAEQVRDLSAKLAAGES